MRKRRITVLMAALLLVLAFQLPGWAAYPEKPLNILVWGNPGAATDILARSLAAMSEKSFGQPIQVVNKAAGAASFPCPTFWQAGRRTWCLLNTNSMISVCMTPPNPSTWTASTT